MNIRLPIARALVLTLAMPAVSTRGAVQEIEHTGRPSEVVLTVDAAAYIDMTSGASPIDLIRRALTSNRDLSAAELSVTRARARLTQARLFPNPTLDLEHARGTGESADSDFALGVAIPLELGGKRSSRIAVAKAELLASEAELQDRRRTLIAGVMAAYIEAISALRELDVTAHLNDLDVETGKFVQIRVDEGDAPPLELSLLRVEIERLRARRILVRGQLDAAIHRLRAVVGMPVDESLRFRQSFTTGPAAEEGVPRSVEEALEVALQRRPDLKLARSIETVAAANASVARAQLFPDITGFATYEKENSNIQQPLGFIDGPDRHVGFGVSLSLPFFNRNQGLRAEAKAAIEQARRQREFTESTIRAEVDSAYHRLEASGEAVLVYQTGVIEASERNLAIIQAAYRLGEFRITDLIAERRRLTDSQREFTELLAERQRALADLHTAMGTLVPEEK